MRFERFSMNWSFGSEQGVDIKFHYHTYARNCISWWTHRRDTSLWRNTTFSIKNNDPLLWISFSRNQCLLKETTWKKIMLSQKVLLGNSWVIAIWLLQFTITFCMKQLTWINCFFLDKKFSRSESQSRRGSSNIKIGSGFKSDLCRIKFDQPSPRAWRWRMCLIFFGWYQQQQQQR